MGLFKSMLFAILGLSVLAIECIIIYSMPMRGNLYEFALYCISLFLIPISVAFLSFAAMYFDEYRMFREINQFKKQLK
jgi:hypothetical protein